MSETSAAAEAQLQAAMSEEAVAPAQIAAKEEGLSGGEGGSPSHPGRSRLEEWDGVLECDHHGPGSGHSDWEVLEPSRVSQCGSSPRTLSEADIDALGPDRVRVEVHSSEDDATKAVVSITPVDHELLTRPPDAPQLPTEHAQMAEDRAYYTTPARSVSNSDVAGSSDNLVSRPASPYSNVEGSIQSSTYSRVSAPGSPSSYHFSPGDVESSDSDWGSENEGEGRQGRGRPRSEPDSEEALRDLEALSQEGSLDGLSDSEANLSDPIHRPDIGVVSIVTGNPEEPAPTGPAPLAPGAVVGAESSVAAEGQPFDAAADSDEDAVLLEAAQAETQPAARAESPVKTSEDVSSPAVLPKKSSSGSLPGLPSPKGMSGKGKGVVTNAAEVVCVYATGAVIRVWQWLKGLAASLQSRLTEVLPQRHAALLRGHMDRISACCKQLGWPVAGAAGCVVLLGAVLACVVTRNRQLARALHSKETEMTRLLIKVFSLQEKLAGARRIPIIRHASHSKCSFGTFASTEYL